MTSDRETRRLFFALWPTRALQCAIHEATVAVGERTRGRLIPLENLHITLIFLGSVPEDRFEAVRHAAVSTAGSPFEIRLDQIKSWRRSGILYLTSANPPQALRELHDLLRSRLLDERFEIEDRPFKPHVTIARQLRGPVPRAPVQPLRWRVDDFVLVQSRTGAQGSEYQVLERWPLRGSG